MHSSQFISSLAFDIQPCWNNFLEQEGNRLQDIEKAIISKNNGYTPPEEKVLRFLSFDLSKCKIIILGQDPYPQPGVATGRAFEVATLHSWHDKFSNVSLKNIVRAIYQAYQGETKKFSKIRNEIIDQPSLFEETGFSILPPDQLFDNWEKQGVLLLNTSFTCETNKPGSHRKLWHSFTLSLLQYIAGEYPDITWFLWGNHALSITRDIPLTRYYQSSHPMICYEDPKRPEDFLFGQKNMFKETKKLINWKEDKSI